MREPTQGNDLVLSIDSDLQAAGEGGLERPCRALSSRSTSKTGEILAMGSAPTFDPAALAKPEISNATSQPIFDPDDTLGTGAPAFNRAIAAGYPTGSTFKPVTALAALDAGELTPSEIINDDGLYKLGDAGVPERRRRRSTARSRCSDALKVSSDVFFYTLGGRLQENIDDDGDEFIQDWAKSLGFGDVTGLDVPGEALGRVPTPEWRNDLFEDGDTDRPWSVGDNINLSVGQGDLLAAPLQLAVAYAALGNGGTVVTPHVGLRTEDPDGKVVQEIAPPPAREVEIDDAWREPIMDGLDAAAMEAGGTSYPVFGSLPGRHRRQDRYRRDDRRRRLRRPGAGTRRSRLRTIPRSPSSTRSRGAASASTAPRRPRSRSSRSTRGSTFRYLSVKSTRQRRLRRTQQVPW